MGLLGEIQWKTMCPPVAKGFSQIEGINYEEIFSPVIHYENDTSHVCTHGTREHVHDRLGCKNHLSVWQTQRGNIHETARRLCHEKPAQQSNALKTHSLRGLNKHHLHGGENLRNSCLPKGFK